MKTYIDVGLALLDTATPFILVSVGALVLFHLVMVRGGRP